MWVPFANWQPDLDPVTPGILVDPSDNFVPTRRGYANSRGFVRITDGDLGVPQKGLFYAMRASGVNDLYGANDVAMFRRTPTGWVAAGSVVLSPIEVRLQFAQYGNLTFAAAKETESIVANPQDFAVVPATPGMPKAAIIGVCNEFVMLGNVSVDETYEDGYGNVMVTPGDYPDRWWCSGVGNPFTWAPSVNTQCTSGQLTDMPGALTAGKALGDRWVFYKQRGIWLGEYTTVPFVWEWGMISKEVGAWGPDCVCVVDNKHYFLGNDGDFYSFDGQKVTPIGTGVREWFFAHANRALLHKTLGFVDRERKICYWGYVPAGRTEVEAFVCFHYENGRWGKSSHFHTNVATEYFADPFTYDMLLEGLDYDDAPNVQYNNVAPGKNTWIPVFLRRDEGALVQMTSGPPQASVLRTSYGGDDSQASLLRAVRSRWIQAPPVAILQPYRLMVQGGIAEPGEPVTMWNGKWSFTSHARWHEAEIHTIDSLWETTGVDADIAKRGKE